MMELYEDYQDAGAEVFDKLDEVSRYPGVVRLVRLEGAYRHLSH